MFLRKLCVGNLALQYLYRVCFETHNILSCVIDLRLRGHSGAAWSVKHIRLAQQH